MSNRNANLHLTLEERRIIFTGIINGSTKTAIAQTIGKDNSTIGKEIKLHRILKYKCKMPLECAGYKKCRHGRKCTIECPEYIPFKCARRDRSPGACNGCSNWASCRYDKYVYDPEDAQHEYRMTLIESREGVNLTSKEAKAMGDIVMPLLKQGLSPYQIIATRPDLGICEKTLYNYIEGDVFHEVSGITVMDLRRQVSRKMKKVKKNEYKKRQDRKFLKGRTYKDYQSYIAENPEAFVVQMDTVYNDVTNGPFMQTFKFLCCNVMLAIYHNSKTADDMVSGIEQLERLLGKELFGKHVNVILTDRGGEFASAEAMESSENGSRRTRVFYCDPMQSGQKGSLENNHIELRYICPKETDLRALGLTDQNQLNLALSHINSAPVEKLGGRCPLEMAEFMYPDLYEKFCSFGLRKIAPEHIILKPYLLKKDR